MDAPRSEIAARVTLVAMVVLGLASLPFWQRVSEQPGIDFYQYWGLAKAQRDAGFALGSPYRNAAAYQDRLARMAAAGSDPQMQLLAASKQWLDVTGTPFVYSLMGSLPTPYSRALAFWRAVQVLSFALAVFVLARSLAHGATAALLALATTLAFDPLLLDVQVGNLSSLQLLGLVVAAALSRRRPLGRMQTLLVPVLLVLLTLVKPIVGAATGLLGLALFLQGDPRQRVTMIAAAAAGALLLFLLPAPLFGSVAVWGDWWGEAFGSGARLAYAPGAGNYSGVALLAAMTGGSIAGVAALVLAVMAISLTAAAWPGRSLLADPLAAVSLGVLVLLAVSPLVWSHYQVLAVIPALWLCGATAGWPRWLGWAALVLVADPLRRLLMLWSGLPVGLVDAGHAWSWVPLWIGALGVYRARFG